MQRPRWNCWYGIRKVCDRASAETVLDPRRIEGVVGLSGGDLRLGRRLTGEASLSWIYVPRRATLRRRSRVVTDVSTIPAPKCRTDERGMDEIVFCFGMLDTQRPVGGRVRPGFRKYAESRRRFLRFAPLLTEFGILLTVLMPKTWKLGFGDLQRTRA